MAELKPYNPTLRDRLAQMLMGDTRPSPERRHFVEGMLGSTGLGNTGIGLADLVPGGQVFALEEAVRAGDPQAAGLAIMPLPGASKAARVGKALEAAPFPHYAERYPPVAPPELKVDPKSGKEYLGKGQSAEIDAFMKERGRIAKDMQKHGFDPYFDPAARYDVDPSHYPMEHRTLTDNRPAKQATRDKYTEQTMDPAVLDRLNTAYLHGGDLDMRNWYAMGQLEKEFIDELGEDAGREAFRQRFAGAMAATTGGADPTGNLLSAHYGNYLRANDLPYPSAAHEMPAPIGGRYITGNMALHEKLGDAGMNIPGADNPKRYDFMANYLGHTDRATIDEQMMGLIEPGGKMAPPSNAYGHFEEPVHVLAERHGVSPREFQEVAWGGAKKDSLGGQFSPVPMIQTVNEAIERTHRLTGMPKKEIVRRALVRGEIPLYGMAGAGAMYGLDGQPYDPETEDFYKG